MLCKIAVSFGIVCVASVGAISHAFVGDAGTQGNQFTVAQEDGESEPESLPIKFVQDDETKEWNYSGHLAQLKIIHDRVWRYFHVKESAAEVELEVENVQVDGQHRIRVFTKDDQTQEGETETFRVYRIVGQAHSNGKIDYSVAPKTIETEKGPRTYRVLVKPKEESAGNDD